MRSSPPTSPLSQRDSGREAAEALGLEAVSANVTYQVDTTDFTPVLTPLIRANPDLLVLSGVTPANAPQLIRSARELGFQGLVSTETAQDAQVLRESAGDLANGFISVGGASTPEIASDMMNEFFEGYTEMFGECPLGGGDICPTPPLPSPPIPCPPPPCPFPCPISESVDTEKIWELFQKKKGIDPLSFGHISGDRFLEGVTEFPVIGSLAGNW